MTFGQILIVLASFTNKNVISGPVPATKQLHKKQLLLTNAYNIFFYKANTLLRGSRSGRNPNIKNPNLKFRQEEI